MTPRHGICDRCGTIDILGLVACENVYVCPACTSASFQVPADEIRHALHHTIINTMTDEVVGFYAQDKAVLDYHTLLATRVRTAFAGLLDPELPLLGINMPCGYQKTYQNREEIPATSVPCDCGWPNHWFLKYAKEPAEVKG